MLSSWHIKYWTLRPFDPTELQPAIYHAVAQEVSPFRLYLGVEVLSALSETTSPPGRSAGTEQSKQGSQQQVDELALFVQRDASRIDRIRKRYSLNSSSSQAAGSDGEDDEHDDYGFNRRPSVRGIRPRFGTTQEIVNQVRVKKAYQPCKRRESGLYLFRGLSNVGLCATSCDGSTFVARRHRCSRGHCNHTIPRFADDAAVALRTALPRPPLAGLRPHARRGSTPATPTGQDTPSR